MSNTDDESPDFRITGTEKVLGAIYSPDAPIELVRHAFQVDLSCYWSIRGCVSTRESAPLLWRDKQVIEDRTIARLHGAGNPCPDSVLAARVRYLPDLNVDLLEVVESDNGEGRKPSNRSYKLKEVIWGGSGRARTITQHPVSILKVGDRVLAFTGAKFESCQIVPATPSAESGVRSAVPTRSWRGDEVSIGGRM